MSGKETTYILPLAGRGADARAAGATRPAVPRNMALSIACAVLICVNVALFWAGYQQHKDCIIPQVQTFLAGPALLPQKAPLSGESPKQYRAPDSLSEEPLFSNHQAWNRLLPSGDGIVALEDAKVKSMGLPPSIKSPLEENKSLYVLAAYHELNCLKTIRDSLLDHRAGHPAPDDDKWVTLQRCLDDLRHSISCNPDTTLLAQPGPNSQPGEGQVVQCKSLAATDSWLDAHGHMAYEMNGKEPEISANMP